MDGLIAKFGDNVSAKVSTISSKKLLNKRISIVFAISLCVCVCVFFFGGVVSIYIHSLAVHPRVGGQQCSESLSRTIAAVCRRIGCYLSTEKRAGAYDGMVHPRLTTSSKTFISILRRRRRIDSTASATAVMAAARTHPTFRCILSSTRCATI